MPIPVACSCGKSFAAPDNLAGKTVRCPGCQQPLAIPAAGQAAPQTRPQGGGAGAGKIVVACGCGAKFAAGAELAGRQVKCPKCGQALTVGAGQPAAAPQQPAAPQPQTAGGMIPIVCQCGAKFGAKPELRGKTIKCPKCSAPLTVGAGAPAAANAPGRAPAASAASVSSAFGGGAALGGGMDDLFDEIGLQTKATGDNACPACGAAMAAEAVLCIECGYNRQTGKKIGMQTVKKVEAKKLGPPPPSKGPSKKSKSSSKAYNPDAQLTAIDYLFVFLCGWIALIVAIIYMAQGNPKGKPMLIAWCVIQAIMFGIGMAIGTIMAISGATAGG